MVRMWGGTVYMGTEVINKNRNCVFNGPYAGCDLYITMF